MNHQHQQFQMNGQPFIQNINGGLVNGGLIPTINTNSIEEPLTSPNHPLNPATYTSPLSTSPNFSSKGLNYDQYPPAGGVLVNNNWIYPPQQPQLQQFQLLHSNYELNQGPVQHFNSNLPNYSDFSLEHNERSSIKADSLYSDGGSPTTMSSSTSSSPTYTYSKSSDTSISSDDSGSPSHRRSSTSIGKSNGKAGKDGNLKIKRSRLGCLTCRHRKKRCCETKPGCHECRRLGLTCTWPLPGLEHKNRPRNSRNENEGMHYDAYFGNIKILRGIVESS